MSSLPEDLESLLTGQPPVDWPGAVGVALSARQQRTRALLGLAALLVVALLGTGLVLLNGDDPEPSQQAEQISPTPTPSTTTAAPSFSPIPEIVPVNTSLPPDATCETGAPPEKALPEVTPGASDADNEVTLTVQVSCTTVLVGQPIYIRAVSTATQDKATEFSTSLGAGLAEALDSSTCTGTPTPGAGPGAAQTVLSGAFAVAGPQTVTVQARSDDACSAKPGGAAVVFDVNVLAATPTATPTASASPSASASATATPSATPSAAPSVTTPPPSTTAPAPDPVLTILAIEPPEGKVDAQPGQTVLFTVTLSSNAGEPTVTARAGSLEAAGPSVPSCSQQAFSTRSGSTEYQVAVPVKMPTTPGTTYVKVLAYLDPGCTGGKRLSREDVYMFNVTG